MLLAIKAIEPSDDEVEVRLSFWFLKEEHMLYIAGAHMRVCTCAHMCAFSFGNRPLSHPTSKPIRFCGHAAPRFAFVSYIYM